jgi:hypothetical protein
VGEISLGVPCEKRGVRNAYDSLSPHAAAIVSSVSFAFVTV